MAVTLLQAAQDQRVDQLEGSLIMMYDQFSPVVTDAPAVGVDELYDDYERVTRLPSVAWRPLNSAWTESSGETTTYREHIKFVGGEVKVDIELVNGPRGQRTVRRQTEMKVLAATNELDRAIFEGSEFSSAHELVGLRSRITGNQLILNAANGGGLSLAKVRELIDAVPFSTRQQPGMKMGQGIRKVLYMNRRLRGKLDSLIEGQTGTKQIIVTNDTFGRRIEVFDDAIIRVVEESGTGTSILGFDEAADDGGADCASIYCVAWGEDTAHLLYRRPSNDGAPSTGKLLRIFRVPEMESEPRMLLRFSGGFGLQIPHPRAVARLYGITAP